MRSRAPSTNCAPSGRGFRRCWKTAASASGTCGTGRSSDAAPGGGPAVPRPGDGMKITKVEAIPLRIPDLDATRADGIQDDVIVRIHTDAGLTGVGEADASPEVVKIGRASCRERVWSWGGRV